MSTYGEIRNLCTSMFKIVVLSGLLVVFAGCSTSDSGQGAEAETTSEPNVEAGTTETTGEKTNVATGFDAATRDDEVFNQTFSHEFAQVEDVRMHYVVGGEGPPLVLLHGWPQTWYEWREIMPALAERYTVIAVDLPGLGDSEGQPPSYDKRTLAQYVHGLISDDLGYQSVNLVGHDLGAGVGYQYAEQYGGEVQRFAFLDYVLPGPAISASQLQSQSWHFAFHDVPELPEEVTADDEREYFDWFYDNFAANPDAISDEAVDEFVRAYSEPAKLSGGYDLYRTLEQDTEDNKASAEEPLQMPVLVMASTQGPGGEAARELECGSVQPLASDVSCVAVPDAGHWLAEENPEFVTERMISFFE